MNLRTPGPTTLHPEVAAAVARPMINYRGPEMAALLGRIAAGFADFLGNARPPVLLTASGTGGMEAALANTLSPGDRVLGTGGGFFAERFLAVARAYGLEAATLDVPWGAAADPDDLRRALREAPGSRGVRAVLLTHCETSTGILHPAAGLIRAAREESDALVLVDAVSSLGAAHLEVDDCDVAFTASQKAWGLPPGIAMVWVSERAEAAAGSARLPRFYWDFSTYRAAWSRGTTPSTPALPVLFAMDAGLARMRREGRERVFARHEAAGAAARRGARDLGLEVFGDAAHPSPTVTAVRVPETVRWKELSETLAEERGVVLAGGMGETAGSVFRIGHLGWVGPGEIEEAMAALGSVLEALGAPAA